MYVIFRADSSHQIGTGHITRCLTLARELRRNGAKVSFVCEDLPGNSNSLVTSDGFELRTSVERADLLVVDHYQLGLEWEKSVRAKVSKIFVIDDFPERKHDADLVLIPSALPDGPRFALIREEFREARARLKTRTAPLKRLLVFFGGTDPTNETAKALIALEKNNCFGLKVDVVVGGQNPQRDAIAAQAKLLPGVTVHVQTTKMAELMAEADLALGAGGTAVWERCCLGLPSIVVSVSENQSSIVKALADQGYHYAIRPEQMETEIKNRLAHPEETIATGRKSMQLVDGNGCQRVAALLLGKQVMLREIKPADLDEIRRWKADPKLAELIIAQPAKLTESEAVDWLLKNGTDKNQALRGIHLIECDRLIGIARLMFIDWTSGVAELGIYIGDEANRGKGLGAEALDCLLKLGFHELNLNRIWLKVAETNKAAVALYRSHGFKEESKKDNLLIMAIMKDGYR